MISTLAANSNVFNRHFLCSPLYFHCGSFFKSFQMSSSLRQSRDGAERRPENKYNSAASLEWQKRDACGVGEPYPSIPSYQTEKSNCSRRTSEISQYSSLSSHLTCQSRHANFLLLLSFLPPFLIYSFFRIFAPHKDNFSTSIALRLPYLHQTAIKMTNPSSQTPSAPQLFGTAIHQVRSTTRAKWSSQDVITIQNFAQRTWERGIARRGRPPPYLGIRRLMEALDLAQFSSVRNIHGDELGPILETKVRRKLQVIWTDLPTLLHVSDVVRSSLGKTRSQTASAMRRSLLDKGGITKQTNSPQLPRGRRVNRANVQKPADVPVYFTTSSMLKPAVKHEKKDNDRKSPGSGYDLVLRPCPTQYFAIQRQQAATRRFLQVPALQAAPTPEKVAQIRGRKQARRKTDAAVLGFGLR